MRSRSWSHGIVLVLIVIGLFGCISRAAALGPGRELPDEARALLSSAPAMYAPEKLLADGEAHMLFERELPEAARAAIRREATLDLVAAVMEETILDSRHEPVSSVNGSSGSAAPRRSPDGYTWNLVDASDARRSLGEAAILAARDVKPCRMPRSLWDRSPGVGLDRGAR